VTTSRKGGRARRTDDRKMIGGVLRRCRSDCPARGCPKPGHTWAYVIAEPSPGPGRGRKVWRGGYPSETDAKAARRAALVDIDKGRYVRPSTSTLATVATRHLASLVANGRKAGTVSCYESDWRVHIEPALGHRPVGKISAADVEAFYATLVTEKGLAAGSVARVAGTLSGIFSSAERWELVQVNPTRRAMVPGRRSGRDSSSSAPLTPDKVFDEREIGRFLAGIRDVPDAAVSILAAATGMRRGELRALRWDDVDLDAGLLTVRRNRVRVRRLDGTREDVEDSPKNGRERKIALDPDTVSALRALRDRQRRDSVVTLAERRDAGGHVLLTAVGEPLTPHQVNDAFSRHVAAVKGLRRPGGIHCLRHSHASLLLANGEPVAVVAKRLGDTIAVVEKTYSHWIKEADERAAASWHRAVSR
jgi:integrase